MLNVIHDCPNLDFLLLTKRPENFRARLEGVDQLLHGPTNLEYAQFRTWVNNMRTGWADVTYNSGRENYWLGTSAEDQAASRATSGHKAR